MDSAFPLRPSDYGIPTACALPNSHVSNSLISACASPRIPLCCVHNCYHRLLVPPYLSVHMPWDPDQFAQRTPHLSQTRSILNTPQPGQSRFPKRKACSSPASSLPAATKEETDQMTAAQTRKKPQGLECGDSEALVEKKPAPSKPNQDCECWY
jgi:hypothetical protein